MQAIKASGAKYVVLVAKHHDGFCLWPTAQTDYSVKPVHGKAARETSWRGGAIGTQVWPQIRRLSLAMGPS